MATSNTPLRRMAVTIALCVVAMGLLMLPDSVTDSIRSAVRDTIQPGQALVGQICERMDEWSRANDSTTVSPADLATTSRAHELAIRRLQIANHELQDELRQARLTGVSPYIGTPGEPLLVPELVEARVVGHERGLKAWSGMLITAEEIKTISAGLPVIDAASLWLDQGVTSDVAVGLPVYSGRCVVGRIAHAGSHVATVRLVTDRDYRGRAQLARETSHGLNFGAEGILEGTGSETCVLRHITATTAVSVGDGVYTGGRSDSMPYPMYYGTVASAELAAGARDWSIVVRPAAPLSLMKSVQVLRQTLNSARSLGN
ncbi:MAG: hypothetical protein O3A00_07460 [Planctomycetota bacterium]|nr:hypothetical protein [Planctomycetota bacterium]